MARQRTKGGVGGGDTGPFIVSFLYVIGFSVFAVLTMVKTKFNNRMRIGFLAVTVILFFFLQGGHLITLIPKLFGSYGVRATAGEVGLEHIAQYSFPLTVAALLLTLGLTFIIGRAVCGYGCPVGAVQELLYDIQIGKKGKYKLFFPTKLAYIIRLVALFIIIILILSFNIDLIQVIAPYQIWRIELVYPGFIIITAFFTASLFVYRAFCRLFCPYGAVASPIASFARLKLEKTDQCTECGLCDATCPTGEISEKYGECYLCGRCIRTCNVDAIEFR